MNDAFNPYAPPKAAIKDLVHDDDGVWRDGKVLVARKDTPLPHRCLKCNADAPPRKKPLTLYWHHPGWYVLVLLNIVFYAIVAMVVRKRAKLSYSLCPQHLKKHRLGLLIGWGGTVLMLGGIFIAVVESSSTLGLLCGAGLLGSLITGLVLSRIAYPARIGAETLRIKGCGAEFLDSLPIYAGE